MKSKGEEQALKSSSVLQGWCVEACPGLIQNRRYNAFLFSDLYTVFFP